jgi:hypothetical protein
MRIPALPLIASVALFAGPALAQPSSVTAAQPNTSASPNASSVTENPSMATQGGGQPYTDTPSSNQQSGTDVSRGTRRALRQSLQGSGFRNVTVEPRTFVVHAQAPDGSHIVMLVGPERVSGVIMNMGNATQPNESTQNGSSNWNQGSTSGAGNSAEPGGPAQSNQGGLH